MTDRRTLIGFAAIAALIPASRAGAADSCPPAEQTVAMSALLDRYAEAANAHDTTHFPEIFADDYIQHSGRSASGLAAQIANAARLTEAFPDRRLTIEDRVIAGDRIVARCTYVGTQRGTFLGFAPTGKQITIKTIDIWRVEGGKLAEHWDCVDFDAVRKQLSAA